MPTYEFRCKNGHEFTRFYKTMSSAATELPCRECDAVAERQISAGAGFAFKGSGFYLTDYGKNAHRTQDGGGPTASKGEKKTESTSTADSGSSAKSETSAPKSDGAKSESKKSDSAKPKAEGPRTKASAKE